MAQPKVLIAQGNFGLGRTAALADGIAAFLIGAVAPVGAGLATLNTPFVVNSLAEAEAVGITPDYDVANGIRVHGHLADFYREGDGPTLHVQLVPRTTTLSDMVDKGKAFAAPLLRDENGAIKLLGVARNPPADYVPTIQDGLDLDVITAISLAKELQQSEAAQFRYLNILLEGRSFSGNTADVKDLRAVSGPLANRVSVCLATERSVSVAYPGYAAVGLLLGRAARIPVQRNVGRVKDGAVPVLVAGLSNGLAISSYTETQLDVLNDKGYIFLRKHVGKDGFYFNDDHTATRIDEDYSGISRGRVMDKASLLVRQVYVNELLDDIDVDANTGRLQPSVVKSYQRSAERVIEENMQTAGEVSGVAVNVDPDQDVLSTDTIVTEVRIVPKGIARQIVAKLQYATSLDAE